MQKSRISPKSKSNFRIYLILFIALLTNSNGIFAQSLIDKLGGVTTEFTFTSLSTKLPVSSQSIIKRGHYDSKSYTGSEEASAYGYGLQTYHLEIISSDEVVEKYKDKKGRRKYYEMTLLDENNNTIMIVNFYNDDVRIYKHEKDIISYSFNLYDVPLILFDKTKKIDIVKIRTYK